MLFFIGLIQGSQLHVYFDDTEVGEDLINFPCTDLPDPADILGPESAAYECTGPTGATAPIGFCTCIVKPNYMPTMLATEALFYYKITPPQKCGDLGPYYCKMDTVGPDTICYCFRKLRSTDISNNGFCLRYDVL